MKTRLHVLVALLCPVLLAACSSGDSASGGAHDAKAPFGPTTRTAIHRVKQTNSDGSTVLLEGRVKGDVTTTSGETLTQYVMVDPNDSTVPEKEIWANPIPLDSSGTVKLGLFDDHESVRLVADPPASFNFSSPVGSKQTVAGDVTATFPGTSVEITGTGSVEFTTESTNESVPSSLGLVPNCLHASGTGVLTADNIPGNWANMDFTGDFWVHPDRGIIAIDLPELGLSFDNQGLKDFGEPVDGWGNIRAVDVLSPTNPTFKLDTYDVNSAFDADMQTHATMILELRWVDEADARSELEPAYPMGNIEFGTTMGYFASQMVKSDVSFFYPEESGQGYVYWIGIVNQAAKNQANPNDTYHVKVSSDYSKPLRATARIVYKLYQP